MPRLDAFQRQQFLLGGGAAVGREAAELVAGGQHAVARDHDRHRISAHRLADVAGALPAGRGRAAWPVRRRSWCGRSRSRAAPRRASGGSRRCRRDRRRSAEKSTGWPARYRWMSEMTDWIHGGASSALVLWHLTARRSSVCAAIFFRQLHADEAARVPRHAAFADRGVEQTMMGGLRVHARNLGPRLRQCHPICAADAHIIGQYGATP